MGLSKRLPLTSRPHCPSLSPAASRLQENAVGIPRRLSPFMSQKKKKKIQRSRDSQEGAQADDVDDDAPPGYVKNKPGVKKKEKKKDIKIKFRNLMYAALVRDSNLKMKMYVLVVGVNCSSLTHIPPPCAAACPNK